jgi:hypothetical protein
LRALARRLREALQALAQASAVDVEAAQRAAWPHHSWIGCA